MVAAAVAADAAAVAFMAVVAEALTVAVVVVPDPRSIARHRSVPPSPLRGRVAPQSQA